jgi:hypothetical protein
VGGGCGKCDWIHFLARCKLAVVAASITVMGRWCKASHFFEPVVWFVPVIPVSRCTFLFIVASLL